jgi:hypothetical protein
MTFPTSNIVNTVATGGTSTRTFIEVFLPRDPTVNDISGVGGQYQIQQRWWNTLNNHEWVLVAFSSLGGVVRADWEPVAGSTTAETLTGNTGGPVGPDANNNINVIGDGISASVVGNPGTHTLTISLVGDGSFIWANKSTDFNAVAEHGYFITGNAVATLPAAPAIGDTIKFFVQGAFTLTLRANTGQFIQFATNISSSAGTQSNTASGDACELVYNSTGTQWNAGPGFVGAWNKT